MGSPLLHEHDMAALGMGCPHRVQIEHCLGVFFVPVHDGRTGIGFAERQLNELLKVDHRHDGNIFADAILGFMVFQPTIKHKVFDFDAEVLVVTKVFDEALVDLHEVDFHLGSKPVFGVSGMLQVFIEPTFLLWDLWFD